MKREYVAVIKGPKELIPGGVKFEKIEITEDEIQEFLDEGIEGETEEDAIKYILDDYISVWEQGFCNAQILSIEEFNNLYGYMEELMSSEEWFDNEEEEEEESEWDEWK